MLIQGPESIACEIAHDYFESRGNSAYAEACRSFPFAVVFDLDDFGLTSVNSEGDRFAWKNGVWLRFFEDLDSFFRVYYHSISTLLTPRCCFRSGVSISIQASQYNYCKPRVSWECNPDTPLPWTSFECGYPSVEIPELLGYADDKQIPLNTAYSYVPKTLLDRIVRDNGGIFEYRHDDEITSRGGISIQAVDNP